jgi:uncharacterized protein YndB with AHSA1/START domain
MNQSPATYDGTIERTADGGVIRFERHLRYSIAEVWQAVTVPERLAEWWLPFDAAITVDLREGGEMRFVASGDNPVDMRLTILRVDPPHLMEHTHADPGSVMRWELEEVEDGCIPRLTHSITDVGAAVDNCYVVGLHTSLSRLEPVLAGDPVAWDRDEFAVAQAAYAHLGLAPAGSGA